MDAGCVCDAVSLLMLLFDGKKAAYALKASHDMDVDFGILHNRKTAGTALKEVIAQQKQRTPLMKVHCFEHVTTFPTFVKAYPTAKAIFFIRDPLSRFVSGFYSRLREGRPRYHHPWNSAERRAFKRFTHPNQLAEALSSLNPIKRYCAIAAMKSIGHVKHRYTDFFGSLDFLKKEVNRIAFIGHQPDFDADLIRLRSLLSIDEDIFPPSDDTHSHRNPNEIDKQLSEIAIVNLKKWYQCDFNIYQWCLEMRDALFLI